jgi:hypothetical protein
MFWIVKKIQKLFCKHKEYILVNMTCLNIFNKKDFTMNILICRNCETWHVHNNDLMIKKMKREAGCADENN